MITFWKGKIYQFPIISINNNHTFLTISKKKISWKLLNLGLTSKTCYQHFLGILFKPKKRASKTPQASILMLEASKINSKTTLELSSIKLAKVNGFIMFF